MISIGTLILTFLVGLATGSKLQRYATKLQKKE